MTSARNGSGPSGRTGAFGGPGVARFGEMLVIGIGVTILSLPIVTIAPAFGAGARHMRAHLDDEPDSVRTFALRGLQAVRSGWWFGTVGAAIIAFLLANTAAAAQGALPGGVPFALVNAGLATIAAVAMLRTAARWTPGARWGDLWRGSRTLVIDDPIGSAWVLMGVGVAATVVWMLPPLVVIAPGLIVVSLIAAERRPGATSSRGTA